MTVKDIYEFINSFAPFSSQCSWDNSGLLIGDAQAKVNKAVISLDVTEKEIRFAAENNAELIISHHPVIFRAIKNIHTDSIPFLAISNNINIISAHTNLDKSINGVNDALCSALCLDFEKADESLCEGFLNIISLKEPVEAEKFAIYINKKLKGKVDFCSGSETVSKLGVCSGAGADFISEAIKLGCDGFITGDASYHNYLDARASGISLFAAGHYETEVIIVPHLKQLLEKQFTNTEFIEYISETPIKTVN